MVFCASVSHAFSWGHSATAPHFSPSICNLLSFTFVRMLYDLYQNQKRKIFQQISHFLLTAYSDWCIIYTYRSVRRLFDSKKGNEKRKGGVSGAFYLFYSLFLSLSRAALQTPTAPNGAREEQVSRPALFFFAKQGTVPCSMPFLLLHRIWLLSFLPALAVFLRTSAFWLPTFQRSYR